MDEAQLKAFEELLEKKIPEMVQNTIEAREADTKSGAATQVATGEKSVMRSASEGELAWKAPFVTVGEGTKRFLEGLRKYAGHPGGAVVTASADFREAVDADGGYLLPEDVQKAVYAYMANVGIFRKLGAQTRTTASNRIRVNKVNQNANSFGGVAFAWEAEGDAGDQTNFKFSPVTIQAFKLMALTVMSNEFLQDTDESVANLIVQMFGQALAYAEDMAFLKGTGTGQPLGLIATPNVIEVARKTAAHVAVEDIDKMFYALKPSVRANSVWLANTEVAQALDAIVDANGRKLLNTSIAGAADNGVITKLKGRPFIELDEFQLSALGTRGDLVLFDPSRYVILDKSGLAIDISTHARFVTDETTWRFKKRVGGKLIDAKAAVVLADA